MKKLFSVFFLFSTSINFVSAQNQRMVSNLATLGKTWGLLKYYHPEIATGKHDWDSILIVAVNQVLESRDPRQANTTLNQLLAFAGTDTAATYSHAPKDPICYRNYDLSWIDRDKVLSDAQKSALHFISTHPYQGVNYYARPNPGNDGTVMTPDEKRYPDMVFPDVNYRLLCLFRFWNVINYFYPYKYLIGESWNDVLRKLIPPFINAKDTLSYHKALSRMAASIHDSHCGLWPQVYNSLIGRYSPPFNFRLIENKAVVTRMVDSAAANYSVIQPGSVIETMDGVPVKEKIRQYGDYLSASNNGSKLRDMHGIIFSSRNKTARMSGYQPGGKKFNATVPLIERNFIREYSDFFDMNSTIVSSLLTDSIGYIFFPNIDWKNMDSIIRPLLDKKAIIFDMRNYPSNGSGAYYGVPDYLLAAPTIYARNTRPDFTLPGMMEYANANQGTSFDHVGKDNAHPYGGKIILLVDERTQSEAEWACMVLKTAPNVTVIGRQTAGADGNVTGIPLPGGYMIFFSGLGIYYPDGTETQRTGIQVDIPVNYTIQDMINKNDPVLRKAIDFINSSK